MSEKKRIRIPRRSFIAGLASGTGLALTGCGQTEPPTYGNILRAGDWLTYKAHRLLLPDNAMAREYDVSDISPMPATGTVNPGNDNEPFFNPEHGPTFARELKSGFTDWRIPVEGKVDRPGTFSLADLKRMPSRTHVTRHTCEEGWSAITQWTGVPLRHVLEQCGIQADARYVHFFSYDVYADGIDMVDALNPQTILAYGMNGRELPLGHGAPLRLRIERQVGFKSMKFLRKIVVTDHFDDHGAAGDMKNGWAWYNGI
jgi:DMSO/TMAO reductase YedYZ molybdopterin-dependent catalytic subunit